MKKTIPLFITFLAGLTGAVAFFVPAVGLKNVLGRLQDFGSIIAAAAFVLGGVNIIQVNVPIVARRRPD